MSIIGSVLIAALLTACASPSDQPAAVSASPSGAADRSNLSTTEAAALSALERHERDTYYLLSAEGEIMKKCLESRGISAYPTTYVTDPLRKMAGELSTTEGFALWYADGKVPNSVVITPTAALTNYGYSGAQQLTVPQDPIDTAYYKLSAAEQDAVQVAIDGKNGDLVQVVPIQQSCRGEVNETIYGLAEGTNKTHSPESLEVVGELIDGIPTAQAQSEIRKSPQLIEAGEKWKQCMQKVGLGVSGIPPAAPISPDFADTESAKSELGSETAMAQVGAECDVKTNLNKAYQDAVMTWRIDKLKLNPAAVLEYFDVRTPFIAKAKAYLGVK